MGVTGLPSCLSESLSCVNSRWLDEGTFVGVAELFELELAEWFELEKSRQCTNGNNDAQV